MILIVAFVLLQTSMACADLVLAFTPSSTDAGAQLVGSGTGTATGTNLGDSLWSFTDFGTDYLVAGVGEPNAGDFVSTQDVTGFFRNVTSNTTTAVTHVLLRKDPGVSGDDMRIFTPEGIAFSFGDQFEISLTAIWPETTTGSNERLLFSELIPGTHTLDEFGTDEIFGDISISVAAVPEPSSLALLGLTTGLIGCRRRRTGNKSS